MRHVTWTDPVESATPLGTRVLSAIVTVIEDDADVTERYFPGDREVRITNPPVHVPDPKGKVLRKHVDRDGKLVAHRFRKDSDEAMRRVIEDHIDGR